ncbi:MAG: hypothetical protein HON53_23505 [Planctomycetaceae bacterium]|jgi:hypothetical protein|nr:hypothetical protein [Planctomycetaceae bacterium]MBT6155163.1 hypothetical protein [Planctomycetaceae bacterium]MBT6483321.1 hypothetical protein [Planctomycetaceae bacterium]MBT6497484.1 hypothetical protein [Planctomycetaceae bacterium]
MALPEESHKGETHETNLLPEGLVGRPLSPTETDEPLDLDESNAGSALGRFLVYGLSLPERTVRSTVCLAAGAATEAAAFLVPQAFHDSKTYELVVKQSLKFLTTEVGGVAEPEDEEKTPDDFMARKAVGNFVDMAGLATLHVSPVWFMAILSDVAYGSQVYVLELAKELKEQGLIDDTSTIHHVDDVLEAVKKSSGEAAGLFDRPPLSVEQLKESLDNTRTTIKSADYTRVLPEAELTKYWSEMREVAAKEDVSLLGVSGALTMHTLGKVSTVSAGALTGVKVVGGLFSRHVVGHYMTSLESVRERGFYEVVRESSGPYVGAVWNNFSADTETWTEQLVNGKLLNKAADVVGGWLGGKDQAAEAPPSDATQPQPDAEPPTDSAETS